MYIPEFWCGVIATILAEVVAGILIGLWTAAKGENNDKGGGVA